MCFRDGSICLAHSDRKTVRLVGVKVVLLAGGLGTRMREETEFRPKPMVEVGGKPVLWHIMKVFAAYGHTDFIVCAGYKGEHIKNYFYNYAAMNMDFTVTLGDNDSATFHGSHDEFNWRVTVADTGDITPTGGRIKRIRHHVGDEPFFCTYGDGLAPVDLQSLLEQHRRRGTIATVTVAHPSSRFGAISPDKNGLVTSFQEKPKTVDWVSIGFFVFEPEIFRYLADDAVLEEQPMRELVRDCQLSSYEHHGYWQPMDTYREFQILNEAWNTGNPPWKVW